MKAVGKFGGMKNMPAVVITLVIFCIWEYASRAGMLMRLLFPPPSEIFLYTIKSVLNGELIAAAIASLGRLFAGFLIGGGTGFALGLSMGCSRRLRLLLDPFVAALHPIPKIAIFPFFMFVFGIGETSKIVAIAVTAFFPLLINALAGVREINPVYLDVAQNYGAGKWKVFTRVILPGSLPMIMAGVRIAFNVSLTIAVAVELLAARTGLGVMIWFGWETLNILKFYAAIVVILLIGISSNALLHWLTTRLIPWDSQYDTERLI